jgi:hypothetical protein
MARTWLRTVLLSLLAGGTLASTAFAAGGPADDDEKPGAPPAARGETIMQPSDAPSDKTVTIEKGDSAVRLDNTGVAREGVYNGVTLGGQNLPPKAPKLPLKGPARMTWPGFQVRDGVPTVFLETTSPPEFTVSEGKGAVVVTLKHMTIKLRNNSRPLKVAEFGTDVTEVSAKPRGKDVVVTIKRKGMGTHRERVEPAAGGYSMLVVELPR